MSTRRKIDPKVREQKLARLAEESDLSVDELLEMCTFDSVAPGICTGRGCTFTADYEPDQDSGWCDECESATVASALILAELV